MPLEPRHATVHFICPDGSHTSVTDRVGLSVMDFAVDHGIGGIESQCGGACICTKCHCFVAEEWSGRVGPISSDEEEMLEYIPSRRPTSRLACQVTVIADLDGLTIYTPQERDAL